MARRQSGLVALVFAAGCASVPSVPPSPPHPIAVGINDGFHGLADFAADCPAMIRTPQLSGSALRAFLNAAHEGCTVLALVEGPDVPLVAGFAQERPAAIELGNELELPPHELNPSQYANFIGQAAAALKAADYAGDVIMGGVFAITDDLSPRVKDGTKTAIQFGLDACIRAGMRCKVGVHLYSASDSDLAWLRALRVPIWITEVGFPTRCQPARLQQQADYLDTQIARFSTVPMVERVFLYQRPDAPAGDCSDLGTFGIAGKPAESLLTH